MVAVSERECALCIIWNRLVEAWNLGELNEAYIQLKLYDRVEYMSNDEFCEGIYT